MSSSLENDSLLESSTSSESDELTLHVKSFHNVDVTVSTDATVAQVKQVVRTALGPSTENRYLRLICRGRLLAPDSAPISDFSLRDGDVVHAVLAAAGVRGGQQAALARGTTRRYRGTGVGPGGRVVRQDEEDGSEEEPDEEEGRERLGFDRLRTVCTSASGWLWLGVCVCPLMLFVVWFKSTRDYRYSVLLFASSRSLCRGTSRYCTRRDRFSEETIDARRCLDAITGSRLGVSSQS